jgi:hypothetical protein
MDTPKSRNELHRSYRAYLLRMWREPGDGRWRVTLEEPNSEKRRAFGSIQAMIQFLQALTAEEEHAAPSPTPVPPKPTAAPSPTPVPPNSTAKPSPTPVPPKPTAKPTDSGAKPTATPGK